MTRDEVEAELKSFIVDEILDGKPSGIDSESPLLEWGVLDSMVMANMLAFIEGRFGIEVPPHDVSEKNFRNLSAISSLLLSLPGPSK